jgi:UDP-N-acetyl-2-amino-2-deoxyglucuronate dehydrogenase
MSQPFGFAIVGCGMIARFHVKAILEIPGAYIAGLVSRKPESAKALIEETKIPACPIYSTVEEAVKSPDINAIVVTTPSGAHAQPSIIAANAGKHIVVEKPLEITTSRCDEITQACQNNRVKLCTIFPSRFADSSQALKKAVDSGKFGRLTLGETTCKWWRSQAYYDEGGWKGTMALDGGGALMNQAIHSVDLLLWMMGEATHVTGFTATLAHERIEVEDTAAAVIRFKSGALGVIQATTSVHPGYPKTIAVHGDRGSAVIEQEDVLRWNFSPTTPEDDEIKKRFAAKVGASGGAADPKAISYEGHRRQLADFVDAVRNNREPAVDGKEGRKAVQLITAIYESNRTEKTVKLT